MEKKLNKKIETYITSFKDAMRSKIVESNFEDKAKINELLEFMYDYERLILNKDDFVKRKRVKNSIPVMNRCNARRANGEQCTRRRREDCEFCGTHSKGAPHGMMLDANEATNGEVMQKVDVFAEEIKGIVYYIDKFSNVYKTNDILEGKENPEVIAKYIKLNGVYAIPDFGLI
jgi:hypothetical protein